MKNAFYAINLISSILVTAILLYFIANTSSPKIIFVPFLICSLSMAGLNGAKILNNQKHATLFQKLFIKGFLLFWFGFLIVAVFIIIRDKQFSTIIFLLPFWLVGIGIAKKFF